MIFSFPASARGLAVCALAVAAVSFCSRAQPYAASVVSPLPRPARSSGFVAAPDPTVNVKVAASAYMHFLALPLGHIDGAIVGRVQCEPRGHRAAFVAIFPGAADHGDWRRINPTHAFVFDMGARTLRALVTDAMPRSMGWPESGVVRWADASGRHDAVIAAQRSSYGAPPLRFADPSDASNADIVAQAGDGRLQLGRDPAGRYTALQVGARALRFEGTCDGGGFAFVGGYVAWVDRIASAGAAIAREGPDSPAAPNFSGSAYGDALVPVLPLGHSVYQASYRNGAAYFAFTYGMQRILARTRDLQEYAFPRMPAQPEYTVGDGFGADREGQLYFARPEDDQVLYGRNGSYVRERLHFPPGNGRLDALQTAMQTIAMGDPLWPPLRPDEDALDAALVVWRIYPVGDTLGQRWIASYLGHVMLSDAAGNFSYVSPPRFPFAVLGRTDDGRIWGAAPLWRAFANDTVTGAASSLWWTRDGRRWQHAADVAGDAGAIGSDGNACWAAISQPWQGRPAIALQRLDEREAWLTGGTYAGEQLLFAQFGDAFYLLWGATPGRRLAGDQGTLSAYRVDQALLAHADATGPNIFTHQLVDPSEDPSLPAASSEVHDAATLAQATVESLRALANGRRAVLATDIADATPSQTWLSVMSLDQERAFEIKYAARPYPLGKVEVRLDGDTAFVQRTLWRGPLTFDTQTERWARAGSAWRRSAILSHSGL
ncbi:MAG: hypothetical protein M3Z37_04815 [Candidatus Eremiobacteraeota bacterium]|nr:hypothetical protein [Candidatus Eremiobacteraeota bacterium]